MSLKLNRNHYWMCNRYVYLPDGSEGAIRARIHGAAESAFGVELVTLAVPADAMSNPERVRRVLRIYAEEDIYYWLVLAWEGTTAYSLTPEMLRSVLADRFVRDHFVGLFIAEPTWAPSLTHSWDQDDVWPWFDSTHYQIDCRAGGSRRSGPDFVATIVEPLSKPIENPVEAAESFRVAFHRWIDPFLDQLAADEVLTTHSWTGSKCHFYCGYHDVKFAQALEPFDRWSLMPEINNQDYSVVFAISRGLQRAGGGPWGCSSGGVRWKYHQLWLRAQGLAHSSEALDYSRTMDLPGWLFFVPMAASWAEGARLFMKETSEQQITKHPRVRAAVNSARALLANAGAPMEPEIHTALLKGAAYFAADVPGYETGMETEMACGSQYQAGRNTGHYRQEPASIVATFYPRTQGSHEWEDAWISGNPYGSLDVLPSYSSSRTLHRYDRVILVDWNCLDESMHQRLLDYVRQGGQLVIAAAQMLSQREGRIEWAHPDRSAFFRGGDLKELCGVEFSGGSVRCQVMLDGPCLLSQPGAETQPSDSLLYPVGRLAESTDALVSTPQGQAVITHHAVGQGSVLTVLGPSYTAALGHFTQQFFDWLAHENRQVLSYRLRNITPLEARDLIVHRDLGSKRIALCNSWRRYDMTPRVTLRDEALDTLTVEKIDVYDVEGLAASWQSPAKCRDTWETWVTLPVYSLGLVRYEENNEQGFFEFTWRVIRSQNFYATFDNTSATTRRVGPMEIHTTRDRMHREGTQPEEPDVRSWIEARFLECPSGNWNVAVRVCDAEQKEIRSMQYQDHVKEEAALIVPRDVIGDLFGGWFVTLRGSKQ